MTRQSDRNCANEVQLALKAVANMGQMSALVWCVVQETVRLCQAAALARYSHSVAVSACCNMTWLSLLASAGSSWAAVVTFPLGACIDLTK